MAWGGYCCSKNDTEQSACDTDCVLEAWFTIFTEYGVWRLETSERPALLKRLVYQIKRTGPGPNPNFLFLVLVVLKVPESASV